MCRPTIKQVLKWCLYQHPSGNIPPTLNTTINVISLNYYTRKWKIFNHTLIIVTYQRMFAFIACTARLVFNIRNSINKYDDI